MTTRTMKTENRMKDMELISGYNKILDTLKGNMNKQSCRIALDLDNKRLCYVMKEEAVALAPSFLWAFILILLLFGFSNLKNSDFGTTLIILFVVLVVFNVFMAALSFSTKKKYRDNLSWARKSFRYAIHYLCDDEKRFLFIDEFSVTNYGTAEISLIASQYEKNPYVYRNENPIKRDIGILYDGIYDCKTWTLLKCEELEQHLVAREEEPSGSDNEVENINEASRLEEEAQI